VFTFLYENLATVLISAALLLAVILIVRKLLRDRKKGGCAGCPYAGNCTRESDCSRK